MNFNNFYLIILVSFLLIITGIGCGSEEEEKCKPIQEICNGVDDDCDDKIDEELPAIYCGVGECYHSIESCLEGVEQVCDPLKASSTEICDGLDNDCDGQTDEELSENTCGKGKCEHTQYSCIEGKEKLCDPLEGSAAEVCDGLDNDCDGDTDEDYGLVVCGTGVCERQMESCVEGVLQQCDPIMGKELEICDGLDNDCDGNTDEGLGETVCGMGECTHTQLNCFEGQEKICDSLQGNSDEVCDGLDNNCDGLTDNELGSTNCGLGVCEHDQYSCVNGIHVECDPLYGSRNEVCDSLDNDCDGDTDEEMGSLECGVGECYHIQEKCVNGRLKSCDPTEGKSEEICDGKDNDCDGFTDEALEELSCGQGECAHTVPACISGVVQVCDPLEGKGEEICDSMDNDCDGETDEELGEETCGVGICLHTQMNCVDGKTKVCDPLEGKGEDICDGFDNNCDGETDENLPVLTCGLGECAHDEPSCIDGEIQYCDPLRGKIKEICDELDNDCDGDTDEDLGESICGLGVCVHSQRKCIDGETKVCDPMEGSAEESCDSLDNDCDGETDEGLGEVTCGLGVCKHTQQNCVDGNIMSCDDEDGVSTEICDGEDNDCDGNTDEDLGNNFCGLGQCEHSVPICEGGELQECYPFAAMSKEVCDDKDNDCDGKIDVSLRGYLQEIGKISNSSIYIYDIFIEGLKAYICDSNGIRIMDIADPSKMTQLNYLKVNGFPTAISVASDYAYVATKAKLDVMDISDPDNPVVVSEINIQGTIKDILVEGDYIYIAAGSNGLRIIDISNKISPTEVGYYNESGDASNINKDGNTIYLSYGSEGLKVIDVSDLENPSETAEIDVTDDVYKSILKNNNIYLSLGDKGIKVFDITDIDIPVEGTGIVEDDKVNDLVMNGDYLYVQYENDGLKAYEGTELKGGFDVASKAFDILGWKPQHSEIENIIRSAKDFEYSQDYFIQEFGQNKEKTL